ncbi:MAG: T9SS C-terminal target domain-containing protein [Ignavibacteriae bacterium]|nr:MAG: T9SS C-terminal target domain-containing protein [Ignavibacteriota bacterium]
MKKNIFIRMMKYSYLLLVLLPITAYFSFNAFNFFENSVTLQQDEPKYSLIRIFVTNEQQGRQMLNAGLIIDHATRKPGQYVETWLSADELKMLQASGVPYEVRVDDWLTYYNNRQNFMMPSEIDAAMKDSKERFNVTHSIYGTMRGMYVKYTEMTEKLDSLRLEYPTLVSEKFSIDSSYENRTMWAVRITKNPDVPTGKPEVMYHALIHAREPLSLQNQLYYVYWLVENYGIDPLATYILDNREIYWIPIYNPDGYVYNEINTTANWRKNRKPCTGGIGTDLNRNYGIYQYWNAPNGGSSTSCTNDLYRGTSPFSEPETFNVMNFVNSRNIKAGLGAHTFGNLLIRPWAYNNSPTPDENIFLEYSLDITAESHYTHGRPLETVGYQTRGGADDWYYNDSGHIKMIQFTPETGTSADGFWPTQARILPLAQGMLYTNQYMSLIAGPYVLPVSKTFDSTSYNPDDSGTYKVVFRNKGLMAAENVTVTWTPENSFVTIPTQEFNFASVDSFALDSCTFDFIVGPDAPVNCAIPTTLTIKLDTNTIYTTSVYIMVGAGIETLNDSAESGIDKWTTTIGWSLHTDYYNSPTHSFAYAPYDNSADYSLTLTDTINMNSVPMCYLSFYNRYSLEKGWDYGYVEVTSNNGDNWSVVAQYTDTNLTWTQQSFDITQYVNASSQVKIRFRLTSDDNTLGLGWWVDDIRLTNYCLATEGIINQQTGIPGTFSLAQNYPNPFNPSTTIKYQIPKAEFVTIKVYDIMGREVTTLVNDKKMAGFHNAIFNGTNYASGVYFYRIEAGSFVETKKMVLIK